MKTPDDIFAALAEPNRRAILRLLAGQERPVQELSDHFPISRPAISKHLRILREAGLVSEHKIGRQRFYRLQLERLREVRDWILYFDQFWTEKLSALKTLVEDDPE
jgi:DNA-binding transcriptional ArsR family regulator